MYLKKKDDEKKQQLSNPAMIYKGLKPKRDPNADWIKTRSPGEIYFEDKQPYPDQPWKQIKSAPQCSIYARTVTIFIYMSI